MPRVLMIVLFGIAVVVFAAAIVIVGPWREEAPPSIPAAAPASEPVPPPASTNRPTPAPTPPAARKPELSPTPEPEPATGTLVIESDVPETSVFVDRVYLGNAPVTVRNLTPGPHRLNMSVTGYEGVAETIEVAAGTQTISMKFKEIRLDEKLDVVHKHAMGSCRGRLTATPQGLAYETPDRGDAFTAALTALETFEVDYLEKNLRVKVRGGKTYNFTDPEGKADRLYLFHQVVEKARQRLMSGRLP